MPQRPVLGFTFAINIPTPTVEKIRCVGCGSVALGYPRATMTRDGEQDPGIKVGRCIPCDALRPHGDDPG